MNKEKLARFKVRWDKQMPDRFLMIAPRLRAALHVQSAAKSAPRVRSLGTHA